MCLDTLPSLPSPRFPWLTPLPLFPAPDGRGSVERQPRGNGVNVTLTPIMSQPGCVCLVPCNKLHFLSPSGACKAQPRAFPASALGFPTWKLQLEGLSRARLGSSWGGSFASVHIPGSCSTAWLINHPINLFVASNTF